MNSPQILKINWQETDDSDEDKIVIQGTAELSNGQIISAQGLTRPYVLEQINKKFIQQITGQFIGGPGI
jgi:hypothetical protein